MHPPPSTSQPDPLIQSRLVAATRMCIWLPSPLPLFRDFYIISLEERPESPAGRERVGIEGRP